MKISMLSAALLMALALTACQNQTEDDAAAAADTAATTDDAMAQDQPMAPAVGTAPDAAMTTGDAMPEGEMTAETTASGDVADTAMASPDHTTLVKAVQTAGLAETLKGAGPFTVFAPTNAAFDALPAGTVDGLMKPEMKADLSKVLTYHVVPGNLDAAALTSQIQSGNGEAKLTTVQGETLTAKAGGPGGVTVTDAKGNTANVTTADLKASNGVIHVVDKVLMPSG